MYELFTIYLYIILICYLSIVANQLSNLEKKCNLLILSVPDEGYSSNVHDDGYSSNVHDEGYSSNVPDEGYSRNSSCALN